jgi:predicted ATP-binding protein involved in virulence
MYIHKIEIENIRGFEKVELDLDRGGGKYAGWTVLAGRNGSGKSTLLKAIALAVAGPSMAGKLERTFAGWVREGAKEAKARVRLEGGVGDVIDMRAEVWPKSADAALRWEVKNGGPEPSMTSDGPDPSTLMGPWAENPRGWFITGYGPFRRFTAHDRPERGAPTMVERLNALFDEDATFADALRWLKGIHALRLDHLDRAGRDDKENPDEAKRKRELAGELQQVLEHIVLLLNGTSEQDRLLPDPEVRVVDVDQPNGIVVERRGVRFPLRRLSDGYQVVIGLIIDIARQLYECYGYFWVIEDEGKRVVAPEGVVLIDEMDDHLHIEWQKRIGIWLKEHFPNIQFIVTTHSPFICRAVREHLARKHRARR